MTAQEFKTAQVNLGLTNSSGSVLLVAWDVVSGHDLSSLEFEGVLGYEGWMDILISDEDAIYNRSRALHSCSVRWACESKF